MKMRASCMRKYGRNAWESTDENSAEMRRARKLVLLVILKFFVPSHLNRFQLSFVR